MRLVYRGRGENLYGTAMFEGLRVARRKHPSEGAFSFAMQRRVARTRDDAGKGAHGS